MTILFVGSEQEAFSLVGASNISLTTTAGLYQSTYSRGAITTDGTSYAEAAFSSQTEIWIHDTIAAINAVSSGGELIKVYNTSSLKCASVKINAGGNIGVSYYNGSSYVDVMSAFSISPNSTYDIDFHVKIASFGGVVEFYLDGVLMSSFSGNTSSLGTNINVLRISNVSSALSTPWCHSQVIVSTTMTVGMKLATLAITGAGTSSQWTGAYTDINELILSDVTFISDNVNADISTYPVTDIPTGGNFNVGAVIVSTRAERGVTGVQNLELGVRSGGANYWGSPVSGLTTAFAPYQNILTTDPATGLPWTIPAANAVEIGVQALT